MLKAGIPTYEETGLNRLVLTAAFLLLNSTPVHADKFADTKSRAEQGYANAQYELGLMFVTGRGASKNDAEAIKWFQKAAGQGFVDAQFSLGVMYANGDGVAENDTEAARWYLKAADQGFRDAQFELGVMYASGVGVG